MAIIFFTCFIFLFINYQSHPSTEPPDSDKIYYYIPLSQTPISDTNGNVYFFDLYQRLTYSLPQIKTKSETKPQEKYNCGQCTKTYNSRSAYTAHLRRKHEKAIVKCLSCLSCFSTQPELQTHRKHCEMRLIEDKKVINNILHAFPETEENTATSIENIKKELMNCVYENSTDTKKFMKNPHRGIKYPAAGKMKGNKNFRSPKKKGTSTSHRDGLT